MADDDDVEEITNIPVRFAGHDQPALYATHISVRSTGDLIDVRFSQVLQPNVDTEEEFRQLATDGMTGHVLSRVLIPESVFRGFIMGMAEQIAAADKEES